jgi:hypothetical protein
LILAPPTSQAPAPIRKRDFAVQLIGAFGVEVILSDAPMVFGPMDGRSNSRSFTVSSIHDRYPRLRLSLEVYDLLQPPDTPPHHIVGVPFERFPRRLA